MPRWNKKDLPPWIARGDRDRQKMIDWVNFELDTDPDDPVEREFLANQERWANATPEEHKAAVAWVTNDGFQIRAAEHGNIGPLRKKYPRLAPYLHLPKRSGKGDRFPRARSDYQHRTLLAASDVGRIRAIWKKEYGKKNRPRGQISAEEIAAKRWEVSSDDVIRRIKKQGSS
jgi:hypothetical protein